MTSEADSGPRRTHQGLGILFKLVMAFSVPTTLLFVGFAVVAHEVADRELEAELGKRLMAVAASAAKQIRNPEYLTRLEPGDETDIAHRRARRDLQAVATATGIDHLFLFGPSYRSVADALDDIPIGSPYFQVELDRIELAKMFEDGEPKDSVLFEGKNGRLYKAAYAPVVGERSGEVVLAVGVDAPAEFFSRLRSLRRNLLFVGVALVALLVVVAWLFASRLVRPIGTLVDAAEQIGRGDLEGEIDISTRDELQFLGDSMDRMRRDLRARDQRNQMMLAGIAHEIRNPLGGIELFSGILRDELPEGDSRRPHVERIAHELLHLKRVVEDFLVYARRPAPQQEPMALDEIAAEVIALSSADCDAAGLKIEAELEPAKTIGDEAQLRRAFLNLVRNAIQAGTDDRHRAIRVQTGVRKGRAFFAVFNGGPAISEDIRAKMFEPFFTSREKGTGLGLAFVKEIVDDHGGDIIVVSNEKSGTAFTVELDSAHG